MSPVNLIRYAAADGEIVAALRAALRDPRVSAHSNAIELFGVLCSSTRGRATLKPGDGRYRLLASYAPFRSSRHNTSPQVRQSRVLLQVDAKIPGKSVP